ncbi:Uncharacterised protein [Streptococcus pneumoniae]|nr:hypothetical protein [Streptococcus pneumoniae]CKH65958.1 Uncharacterised protein [Streptococcus pneumoniae]
MKLTKSAQNMVSTDEVSSKHGFEVVDTQNIVLRLWMKLTKSAQNMV